MPALGVLDPDSYWRQYWCMNRTRRVTANLPIDLLDQATRASGRGITETLVAGLTLVKRSAAARKAKALRGRIRLDVDLEVSRERSRR
jgi:hypothetical protein